MGVRLILQNADFSENGVLEPMFIENYKGVVAVNSSMNQTNKTNLATNISANSKVLVKIECDFTVVKGSVIRLYTSSGSVDYDCVIGNGEFYVDVTSEINAFLFKTKYGGTFDVGGNMNVHILSTEQ